MEKRLNQVLSKMRIHHDWTYMPHLRLWTFRQRTILVPNTTAYRCTPDRKIIAEFEEPDKEVVRKVLQKTELPITVAMEATKVWVPSISEPTFATFFNTTEVCIRRRLVIQGFGENILPTCPQCRRYVLPDSNFCLSCGLELRKSLLPVESAAPSVCPKCGSLMQRRIESEGDAPFYSRIFGTGPRAFYHCLNCRYKRRI